VVVVVGHESAAVRFALTGLDVFFVVNPDFAEGQSTSLIAGIDAAAHSADAVVILLGDQPGIDPGAIDRLIEARRDRGASIAMAEYGGQRSHPILFGSELFDEIRGIKGDRGARDLIRRHSDDVVPVPGGFDEVPLDVDTDEAYARLLEREDAFKGQ
jgi:molybdenum cofactor cytidylyltransferase